MLGRLIGSEKQIDKAEDRGFDSYQLRLGDIMRGERATMGKSLLDVQRELRIKAAYIAAIEDSDPSVFESAGFIAGYVRSYARYLGLDSEWAFTTFCEESGFEGVHGFAAAQQAKDAKRAAPLIPLKAEADTVLAASKSYAPEPAGFISTVEPGALGSIAVLFLLIGGLGYGGWSVLQELQRVQVAPVEEAPGVIAQLDPIEAGGASQALGEGGTFDVAGTAPGLSQPDAQALDRLYRPQALDLPILTARDAPISTIEPGALGALALPDQRPDQPQGGFGPNPANGATQVAALDGRAVQEGAEAPGQTPDTPRVLSSNPDEVVVFAVRPAWVRVRSADGSRLFEKILEVGETYVVPLTEVPPTLHAGNSGAVYFQINGQTFGPAGPKTSVARNVPLGAAPLQEIYTAAVPGADKDLPPVLAELTLPVSGDSAPAAGQ